MKADVAIALLSTTGLTIGLMRLIGLPAAFSIAGAYCALYLLIARK